MKFKVVIEPSGKRGWYTASVPSLPGCISQGKGVEDTLKNIKEAILLYLEPVEEQLPTDAHAQVIELAV
ncbi:MAG: type II toxin-antitoxin system HicB family antitoxin [PVC group bacterium]